MKYKVGDKVVMKIISADQDEIKTYSVSGVNDDWRWCLPQNLLERYTEPLSTYTEPLEAKIRRQAAEITRLLAENERLKPNYENIRAVGQNEAWELARKIAVIPKDGGYGGSKLIEIFNTALNNEIFNLTYPEAAAKVAEWEKAKEEIKVGDVVESNNGNGERIAVIDVWPSFDGLHFEGISSNRTLTIDASAKYYTKTGRHIDIGSFLNQIGGEE